MKILVNHIGYELLAPKKAILNSVELELNPDFQVFHAETGQLLSSGTAISGGKVPHWDHGYFYEFDFTDAQVEGPAFVRVLVDDTSIDSEIFEIRSNLLVEKTLSDVLNYFKAQRCSDQYNHKDKTCSFFGDESTQVDLSGGWYDASGDVSKYLSHLSYANFMNPQQTPLVVWSLCKSREQFFHQDNLALVKFSERMAYEAVYGADFLTKMVQADGAMVMTVFDKWSKDPHQREACAYETQNGIKNSNWQAGFRQGAGMSIAALAKASTLAKEQGIQGEFQSSVYLAKAELAYQNLLTNNLNYIDDGQENLIDFYCALMAATELSKAGLQYQKDINLWASKLIDQQANDENFDGWFYVDTAKKRPFFHASDAGLPIISLMESYEFLTEELQLKAINCIQDSLSFELNITTEVFNPFSYARQYVQGLGETPRSSFFFPHNNESGYWWQGENARLGSLSTMSWMAIEFLEKHAIQSTLSQTRTQELLKNLNYYAHMQLDWILGLNPYDMCMLDGHGRNNPEYETAYPPCAGGICNGITGGFLDERGIDFAPLEAKDQGDQKWRWGEQWIPHAAWYALAISCKSHYLKPEGAQ